MKFKVDDEVIVIKERSCWKGYKGIVLYYHHNLIKIEVTNCFREKIQISFAEHNIKLLRPKNFVGIQYSKGIVFSL